MIEITVIERVIFSGSMVPYLARCLASLTVSFNDLELISWTAEDSFLHN